MLKFQAAVATRRSALGRRRTTKAAAAAAHLCPPHRLPKVAAATIPRYENVPLAQHSTTSLPSTTNTTVRCLVSSKNDEFVYAPSSSSWRRSVHAPVGDRHFSTAATTATAATGDPHEDSDGPEGIDQRTASVGDGIPHHLGDDDSSSSNDQVFFVLESSSRQEAARVSNISLLVERLAAEENELLRRFRTEADRRTDWVALLRIDEVEGDAVCDEEAEEMDVCGEGENDNDGSAEDATEAEVAVARDAEESMMMSGSGYYSPPLSPPSGILSSPSMVQARRIAAAGRIERALRLYRRNNNHPSSYDNNDDRKSHHLRLRRMNQELLQAFLESVDNANANAGGGTGTRAAGVISDSQGLELLTAFAQSRDLKSAHAVLNRWIEDAGGSDGVPVRAYRILCDAIGECDDDQPPSRDFVDPTYVATYLFETLRDMDEKYRFVCLPRLLLAMCKRQATATSDHRDNRRPRQRGEYESQSPAATDDAPTTTLIRCIGDVYSYIISSTAASPPQGGLGGRRKVAAPPLSSESPYFDPYVFEGILTYLAAINSYAGRERVFRGVGEVEEWGNRLSRSVRERRRDWHGRRSRGEFDRDRSVDDVIPCEDILRALVVRGHYPNSDVVMTTLQNEHPFDTNIQRTRILLKSILRLRRNVATATAAVTQDDSSSSASPSSSSAASAASAASSTIDYDAAAAGPMYRLDLGTIEQLCEAGGRRGKPDVVITCWDLAESMGYRKPTELMYESSIQAFLTSKRREDHHAMAVLAEMEGCGYVPSRSLVRTVSECIRRRPGRIDNMYYILTNGTEGTTITTASFNCILSAYGQSGLIDRAFATFDDFAKYGITPNADSFSFLMESLAFNVVGLTKKTPNRVPPSASGSSSSTGGSPLSIDLEQLVESADMIIDIMRDTGCGMNPHVLHQYLRILTCGGELQRARSILDDAIDSGDRVLIDTLVLFGRQCAFRGEMGMARDIVPDMIDRAGYDGVPHILRETIGSVAEADADSDVDVEEESSSQDTEQC